MGVCGSKSSTKECESSEEDVEPPPETKFNVQVVAVDEGKQDSEESLKVARLSQIETRQSNVQKEDPKLALVSKQTEMKISPRQSLNESDDSVKLAAVSKQTEMQISPRQSLFGESDSSVKLTANTSIAIVSRDEKIHLQTSSSHQGENIQPTLAVIKEDPTMPHENFSPDSSTSFACGGDILESPTELRHVDESFSQNVDVDIGAARSKSRKHLSSLGATSLPSLGPIHSDDFEAGESGTLTAEKDKTNDNCTETGTNRKESIDISDLPTVPEGMLKPNLRNELMTLQRTFLEFRKMKFGHMNSILQEQEQTLMESTAEIHTLVELYESTDDPERQLELEIIMERKFEAMQKEFVSYQAILTNDDESSMLLSMDGADLNGPLLDISETSEEFPARANDLQGDRELLKLASVPLISE